MLMVIVNNKTLALRCFSPPVMIATFIVELLMASYTLLRYKMNHLSRLIVLLLLNLALFQLAEYLVCTHDPVAVTAARFGYAAITFLPPLGYSIMGQLTTPLPKHVSRLMYGLAFLFVGYFLSTHGAFTGYRCTGNYVIFQIGDMQTYIYGSYYYGVVMMSLWRGARYLHNPIVKELKKRAVRWFMIGYLVFLVPIAVLTVVHPDTRQAIPSIMCGFAVSFAIIIFAKIAPKTLHKRRILAL
jgi:hypothetical protein